jgi:Xaa-Pro aminopeptidase
LAVHAERRRLFLDAMGQDSVALLLGARLITRSRDTHYPFRQDSDFWYLTGFDHPHAVAVLRTDGGPAYSLFVEPRSRAAETWTGYRPGIEGAKRDYGADEAFETHEFENKLPEILSQARQIYHVLGRDHDLDAKLADILSDMRLRSRQGFEPASKIVDFRELLHEMRLRKDDAELDILRRAAAITAEAHREAARLAQQGRYEYELAAALEYTFRRLGGSGPAYTSIVAGGRNATTLHYTTNDKKLASGEFVLIDAACELEGYASDVTRTYPVGGSMTGPGRAIYEVVLAAQEGALSECRPGTTLDQIHDAAVRCLVEGLIRLGLLSGSVDERIDDESYRRYYMHRTSHWLGLDTHDVGTYSVGGKPRVLEPGMVFTVEPGIYVADDDEEASENFRGIGVRIEDDVVITSEGYENLTSAIPKQPDDVEAWVREAI